MPTKGVKGIELKPSTCTYIDKDGDLCNYLGKIKSINKELNNKYIEEMDKCFEMDTEGGHIKADGILCNLLQDLGYGELVDKFCELDKWYS